MVSLTISTLLFCSERSFVSSNDCVGDNAEVFGISLAADDVLHLSSLAMAGNDVLSLMLFMVAATLGIALQKYK